MSHATPCRWLWAGALAGFVLAGESTVGTQEPASAPLAAQLAELMSGAQLDAVAGKDSKDDDRFVAALAFPGQLLVVSARYEVPIYIEQKISNGQFRDVYIDLNAASIPGTKVLVTDLGADGLHPTDEAVDMYDDGSGILRLDGDPGGQNLSDDDYRDAAAEADAEYARMLGALIEQAR